MKDIVITKRRIKVELYIFLACVAAMAIQMITPGSAMMEAFFEAASALGTTGLTIGGTAKLTTEGKLLLSFLMFIGRIGPFTIMLFLLGREKTVRLKYPDERVIIG